MMIMHIQTWRLGGNADSACGSAFHCQLHGNQGHVRVNTNYTFYNIYTIDTIDTIDTIIGTIDTFHLVAARA
jgi:hypothetical protein